MKPKKDIIATPTEATGIMDIIPPTAITKDGITVKTVAFITNTHTTNTSTNTNININDGLIPNTTSDIPNIANQNGLATSITNNDLMRTIV